jgi:hypothetical protein
MTTSRRARLARVAAPVAIVVLLLAASSASAAPAYTGAGPIFYVGDSLGVGTYPLLTPLMASETFEGDTRVGRTSTQGLAVLRAKMRASDRTLIFDLGTNDWSATTLKRNLRSAHAWIANRLMVVLTMNKPGVAPLNRVVKAFAASTAGVVLIDWRSLARRRGLLAGDGIHATFQGYGARASLIARVLSHYR